MEEYVNKSALVAEIERQILAIDNTPKITDTQISVLSGNKVTLTKLLSFIDTLETKEVDLEKEIDTLWCSLFTNKTMKRDPTEPHTFIPDPAYTKDGAKIAYKLEIDWKVDEIDADFLRKVAKHFFELGINSK